jgi:O-acetylserine/cysteine efflux transporter
MRPSRPAREDRDWRVHHNYLTGTRQLGITTVEWAGAAAYRGDMSTRDRLLAALVAVIWGVNFPATAIALEHFPPLFLVAFRFAIIAVPTIIFIPRPKVPLRWLIGSGLGIGILQFVFLYIAIDDGLSSGLASIIVQASAPFTVVIAVVWLRERLGRKQWIGIIVAVLALGAIALHSAEQNALLPVLLGLLAGLGWAIGNIAMRKAAAPNPLQLTLWMSVVPPIPMLALAFIFEGPALIGKSLATMFTLQALPSVLALVYLIVFATILGFLIWTRLLAQYPSSEVAPFSMLVPVVGVLVSWLLFGSVPDLFELVAGLFVIAGVVLFSVRPKKLELVIPAKLPQPITAGV